MKPRKIICQRVKELMTCAKKLHWFEYMHDKCSFIFPIPLLFSFPWDLSVSQAERNNRPWHSFTLHLSAFSDTYWSQGELISADSNFSNWDLDWKTHFRSGAKTLKQSSGSSDSFLWILACLLCYNFSYLNSNASWTSTKTLISIN